MRLLVIYDIPSDSARSHVADACLDYGLERVQYSAFAGRLAGVHQRELQMKIARLVRGKPARVRFLAVDEKTWEQQRVIDTMEDCHDDR